MKPVFQKHSLMSMTNEESQKESYPFHQFPVNLMTYH